jgi:hypothetical protein
VISGAVLAGLAWYNLSGAARAARAEARATRKAVRTHHRVHEGTGALRAAAVADAAFAPEAVARAVGRFVAPSHRSDRVPRVTAPARLRVRYTLLVDASVRRRAVVLGLAGSAALGAGPLSGAGAAGPLPPLMGPSLIGPTRLRLIVGDTPPAIFNVDAGSAATVRGVVAGPETKVGELVVGVAAAPGGADVTVFTGSNYVEYFVSGDGSAHRITALPGNAIAARHPGQTWTLSSSRGGCTLRLVPGTHAAIHAPCGALVLDSPVGLVISAAGYALVVDPSTGRVRRRIHATGQLEPINATDGSYLLQVSGSSQSSPGKLALIDLATGTRRHLRWPSILPWVQRIAVEPHGPLVAVGFVSPAYPGPQQANDIWLLNPATATFTHLPGFPAQESVKFSGMAWTSDDRLVIVAESIASIAKNTTRSVLGVWRPGEKTLPLRNVPALASGGAGGYSEFVALTS